jgi:hypothetical protein
MLPEDQIKLPEAKRAEHAAFGKSVVLGAPPHPSYSGGDAIKTLKPKAATDHDEIIVK